MLLHNSPETTTNISSFPETEKPRIKCRLLMTDNAKYVKRGQALIIKGERRQEQGGRAVPIRQVAVCGPDGGEIDGGIAVQALERLKSSNTHEDSVRLYSSPNDSIQFEVREAHGDQGVDPLPRLRRRCFSMCSILNRADVFYACLSFVSTSR